MRQNTMLKAFPETNENQLLLYPITQHNAFKRGRLIINKRRAEPFELQLTCNSMAIVSCRGKQEVDWINAT